MIDFECSYSGIFQQEGLYETITRIENGVIRQSIGGNGTKNELWENETSIEFYKNENFDETSSDSQKIHIGFPIYFSAIWTIDVPGFV